MTIEFQPFPKLARYSKNIIITEKLDGTNAQIIIDEDGNIAAGSRTRLITPGKTTDNFGFAGWVHDNAAILVETLGPGRHFGEWYGQGIQRNYGLEEKRFALFNTSRWKDLKSSFGLTVVPVLYEGPHHTGDVVRAMSNLLFDGSVAVPGYMNPEGIVIFHTASNTLYKKTFDNDEGKWAA